MYENLFKEAQNYKREMVGVEEIKKDRDERVGELRVEIDSLQNKYDKEYSEHSSLKIEFKNLKDEYARLSKEFNTLTDNLKLTNVVRKQKEDDYNSLEK